ncbi:MAG: hypothetical protein IKL73_04745 [Lachnospiraceae bacterium]|nr:hypothetical protein [Lachnospiraceae bacterium]
MSKIDVVRFENAKNKIVGHAHNDKGIGTLSEKTVHGILKNYYEPNEDFHEVALNGYFADIFREDTVIEIQTRAFNKLRDKLEVFLNEYKVVVVYPMVRTKHLVWVDETTGELSTPRKSPKMGLPYEAFFELYKIKNYLKHENLSIKLVMMDVMEYRSLNGYSKNRKKGSERIDRIPSELIYEIDLECPSDYMQMLPIELEGEFTSKDYGKYAKMSRGLASTALNMLHYLGVVNKVGKKGNTIVYSINE